MSGLEKFQATSDWMQRFKSLLSTTRDSQTPPRDLDSSGENSVCLELNEDLHTLLEEKKNKKKLSTTSFETMQDKENFNPTEIMQKPNNNNNNGSKIIQTSRASIYNDSIMNPSFVESCASTFEITNLSFSTIEQACNKSISDPNSTIHNYVEQIRKNNESKNSNNDDDSVEESDLINNLTKTIGAEELKFNLKALTSVELTSALGFADQTQLADVEEPSALWETTVIDNVSEKYHLSPTKLVGLLRPSTILEESSTSSLTESDASDNSYKTASKRISDNTNLQSDSQYETACESGRSDCIVTKMDQIDTKNRFISEVGFTKADINTEKSECSFENYEKKAKTPSDYIYKHQEKLSQDNDKENFVHLHREELQKEKLSFRTDQQYIHDTNEKKYKQCLKNSFAKSDNVTLGNVFSLNKSDKNQESSFDNKSTLSENIKRDSLVTIELSDEESDNISDSNEYGKNLNEGFSIQDIENAENSDDSNSTLSDANSKSNNLQMSREFNDTLEEVEYIMKHGMQMLKNSNSNLKTVESIQTVGNETTQATSFRDISPNSISQTFSRKAKVSPTKLHLTSGLNSTENISSTFRHKVFASKHLNTPPTKNSPVRKPLSQKQTPAKKVPSSIGKDIFRKPTVTNNKTRIPQPKTIMNMKKTFYADVISPVGAYIKKTPICPTETKIKETTVKSLDYGQSSGQAQLQYHLPKRFEPRKGNGPSLPQKCYKLAEYRCVVDERTLLNIPGGESIHKYLKPALMPAVVRHDGKIKMNSPKQYALSRKTEANQTIDSTMTDLNDFSAILADVSMYTLKDAQKFSFGKGKK